MSGKDNLNEANVYHRRVIRNILGLHERSGSGIVITNKQTKKKQVIFPSANVIIYLDFLFSPMEYRWLVNALDFYNSFVMLSQSNDTMRTILRACVRYDTGWMHRFVPSGLCMLVSFFVLSSISLSVINYSNDWR